MYIYPIWINRFELDIQQIRFQTVKMMPMGNTAHMNTNAYLRPKQSTIDFMMVHYNIYKCPRKDFFHTTHKRQTLNLVEPFQNLLVRINK